MSNVTMQGKSVHRAAPANVLMLLALLLCTWPFPGQAGQNNGQFSVTINLNGGGPLVGAAPGIAPASIFCRSGTMVGAFGSSMTVVCATGVTGATTGAPTGASSLPWTSMPDNSYRFMFNAYHDGEQFRTFDSYSGAGTVASWRMIKLNDRDYLEMMLHW